MNLLWNYLKQHRRVWFASMVCCAIFLISFWLYHLPLEAVIYPAVLSAISGFLIMVSDFRQVKNEHKVLKSIRGMNDVMERSFPRADGIKEEDYQKIIQLIKEEHGSFLTETNRRYQDMVDYYSTWVHQIKTPIASMRLNLQNEDSALSRTLASDLHRIEQYVEMVLTFLRLNAESTDYVIKEYDLDKIIKGAVKKFSSDFIGRKLSLVYKPINTTIITDEKWLSFVIEQVLSNALKYTPTGSISITLEKEKTLRIRDTGIGIAPEDLPRVFENGYTGYNGHGYKKASGIGLYLCKRICNNLGHTISIQSIVDIGTIVDIDFMQVKLEVE